MVIQSFVRGMFARELVAELRKKKRREASEAKKRKKKQKEQKEQEQREAKERSEMELQMATEMLVFSELLLLLLLLLLFTQGETETAVQHG